MGVETPEHHLHSTLLVRESHKPVQINREERLPLPVDGWSYMYVQRIMTAIFGEDNFGGFNTTWSSLFTEVGKGC